MTAETSTNAEECMKGDFGEVLEFSLCNENYALDINIVREIVEMMPITVIPRAPVYITGVINLRGEIVNIVNLNSFLKLPDRPITKGQKIIVLMAEVAGGNNVGVIVDTVSSVTEIKESQVDCMTQSIAGNESRYIKGIINTRQAEAGTDNEKKKGLIIWLDIHKMFKDIEKN
ncbi:chemotaxis protein CheW [Methanoregula sp.]|uniref:chemotaxis protein CheW n=1 Tax=Methanoregula sp. TaxID=2052170 RepID=UPI0025DA62C1|nr:chemotaxis protein CheW [Methanoregula sp.]